MLGIKLDCEEISCPKCDAKEMHPDGGKLLIRSYKVGDDNGYWWSQCLVCAGFYDEDLNVIDKDMRPEGGWF